MTWVFAVRAAFTRHVRILALHLLLESARQSRSKFPAAESGQFESLSFPVSMIFWPTGERITVCGGKASAGYSHLSDLVSRQFRTTAFRVVPTGFRLILWPVLVAPFSLAPFWLIERTEREKSRATGPHCDRSDRQTGSHECVPVCAFLFVLAMETVSLAQRGSFVCLSEGRKSQSPHFSDLPARLACR